MKQHLVKAARRLPEPVVRAGEEAYRRSRSQVISAMYGYPARGLRVIAVTGTNGKTTTACYLNEILKSAKYRTAMFTTALIEVDGVSQVNDLNATVATVGRMQKFFAAARKADVDFVVLEVTSHSLQQHKLSTVPIECAIMTNLTQDHLDYHGTMELYAAAKSKLFSSQPRFAVLNRDDQWFDYFSQFPATDQNMSYGAEQGAEARITKVKLYPRGSEATVVFDHQTQLELATALPGKYNVYNMTAAATAAYLLHIPLQAIQDGIADLEGVPGRYERIDIDKPYDVIVDYAHTPDALEKLLEAARSVTKNRVMLVFGATGSRDKAKRPIMGEIAARGADRIFLTDDETYDEAAESIREQVMDGIKSANGEPKTEIIDDRRAAIEKAMKVAKKGDIILIAGMGHEKFRIMGGKKEVWNDGDIVRELATS